MTIIEKIKQSRAAIRSHRDQIGDDRCWLDDGLVWAVISDSSDDLKNPPEFSEAMERCRAFWQYRRSDKRDPENADANHDPETWDSDLSKMSEDELNAELTKLESAIRAHRDISGRERTIDDDRALYRVLPEKVTADFRLPNESEFLGEAKAPKAGCPSFWRSHESCQCEGHDLHSWGPC